MQTTMAAAIDDRYQRILQSVSSLSPMEIDELFKILHATKCEYSRNDNGIFINLRWVGDDVLCKIEQHMAFCTKNRVELEKYEKLRRIMTESFAIRQPRARLMAFAKRAVAEPGIATTLVGTDNKANEVNDADADVDGDADGDAEVVVDVADGSVAHVIAPSMRVVSATGANTTMKFYLLKKRFAKLSGQSSRYEQGELLKESVY